MDVGTVRVGVAVSDPGGLLASPWQTLARDPKGDADLHRIAQEVAERGVVEVLVGDPRSLSGRVGAAATQARGYAVHLAGLVNPVPVRLVDERLSTVTAHQQLHRSGVKGRGHRKVVDQIAAVVILQDALDAERGSGHLPGSLVEPPETEGPSPD